MTADVPIATAKPDEPPEYGNRRRAFLIAALMLNWIPTERVVERVVAEIAEIERETTT